MPGARLVEGEEIGEFTAGERTDFGEARQVPATSGQVATLERTVNQGRRGLEYNGTNHHAARADAQQHNMGFLLIRQR